MYKRGLLGTIALAIIIILLISGAIIYYQVKRNGIQISSGNVVVNIGFNDSSTNVGFENIQGNKSSNNTKTGNNLGNTTSLSNNSSNNFTLKNISESQ